MSNFFLLGLPRCRSVWLSYLLSYGNSYCHHELLSKRQLPFGGRLPVLQGIENVGTADTYPMNFSENIVRDNPLVIIHRPLEDIKTALIKSHGYSIEMDVNNVVDVMYDKLYSIQTDNQININFSDLNKREVIVKIMQHCGVYANSDHIHKLMGSNITTSNEDISLSNHGALFNK